MTQPPPKGARARTPPRKPDPVDAHVGFRIRQRRMHLGMSQEKLANALGVTFQQVQKYESGANRIGASRLWDISQVLDAPAAFFFDDIPMDALPARPVAERTAVEPPEFAGNVLSQRETLELVRTYYRLSPAVRRQVQDLARALAKMDPED
ncbi:MAG: helix-turn-helix domain-containing protein [Actinomycetota bacterium]